MSSEMKTLFEQQEENNYKLLKVGTFWNDSYVENYIEVVVK